MATLQLPLNIPDHLTHVLWHKPSLGAKAVTVDQAVDHAATTAVDQTVVHAAMIAADQAVDHAATTAVTAAIQ